MNWCCIVLCLVMVCKHPHRSEMFGEWVSLLVSFGWYRDKVHFAFHPIWVVLDISYICMKVRV